MRFAIFFFLLLLLGPARLYAQNQQPNAEDDFLFAVVGAPTDLDVLANDSDPDPDDTIRLTEIIDEPDHGTATIDDNDTPNIFGDDRIRYVPDMGYTGQDMLRYRIEDEDGAGDTESVFITLGPPPAAVADTAATSAGVAVDIDVLANDDLKDDVAGANPPTLRIITAPKGGTATVTGTAGSPQIRYTPGASFGGLDSLRYEVTNTFTGRDTAQVFIRVNRLPLAVNDAATVQAGDSVDINVLANDTDADSNTLTVLAISDAPDDGTATILANQRIRYTPDDDFSGSDTFAYVVDDGLGGRDTASVAITVNSAPVAADDTAETLTGEPVLINVLINDTDPNGDDLTITGISMLPPNGTAVITTEGGEAIRYTPDADFLGTDVFEYVISDAFGGRDTASVSVTVSAQALVQFINNVPGLNDVNLLFVDASGHETTVPDVDYRAATGFVTVPAGMVDVAVGIGDSFVEVGNITIPPNENVVVVASRDTDDSLVLAIQEDARRSANDPGEVDVFVVHGAAGAPDIDVRLLDETTQHNPLGTLANDIAFGEASEYTDLDPIDYNIEVRRADTNAQIEVYRFDFSDETGEALTILASGSLDGTGTDAFTLIAFDAAGNRIEPLVVTGTEDTALPTEFTLNGNYPNPFNPSTTIQFDLPATAEVTVEIVDMLGRRVMTVPVQTIQAGADRALELNASNLASGVYVYRVTAKMANDTLTKTGRMTLVK